MMMTSTLAFLGASIALTVAPGPDNLFVITQGLSLGRRAALITAWGMCSGITMHTLAAALGISALVYSYPMAFNVVKYAGAAYLLFLALRILWPSRAPAPDQIRPATFAVGQFQKGFLMNVLNPKVALFFIAFLPQFVNRDAGGIGAQMVLLGLLFMVQAVLIFSVIAWFSGAIGERFRKHPRWPKRLTWLTAAIFIGLAVKLVVSSAT